MNALRFLLLFSMSFLSSSFMFSKSIARVGSMGSRSLSFRASPLLQCTAEIASSPNPTASVPPPLKLSELSLMEIRVGKIVEIGKHPEADGLYVEKVDVGEASGPRTIVSGLVQFCKAEDLLHSKVVVLCNLKPRALKGVTSFGMLLCASNSDHTQVSPITPPEASLIGELIAFDGHPAAPIEAGNKASKAFSKIAEDFFVNDVNIATFKGTPFMTTAGPVLASLKGKIS